MEEEIANGTRLMNIVIVDLNKREIQLKMVQYEMVLELREFLTEHVYTCFFTHYYFEHQGERLNDYTELSQLDLVSEPRIFMRPEKYDEKNARSHIRRVKEILMGPPQLLSATPSQLNAAQAATGILKTGADEESKEETAKPEGVEEGKSEYEERLKKSYEEFMSLVERESKKEIPMPPPKRQTEGPQLIRELFR